MGEGDGYDYGCDGDMLLIAVVWRLVLMEIVMLVNFILILTPLPKVASTYVAP